jgi:hypothetical protein
MARRRIKRTVSLICTPQPDRPFTSSFQSVKKRKLRETDINLSPVTLFNPFPLGQRLVHICLRLWDQETRRLLPTLGTRDRALQYP